MTLSHRHCEMVSDPISTSNHTDRPAAPAAHDKDAWTLQLSLNGQPVSVSCSPDTRLLTLLREHWHLTGAKPGCEIGRCGACMVWLNGAPVNSCLVMAYQLQGQSVRTIESVAQDSASQPVRDALASCGGVQCGYCTAGMVMSLSWLHQQQPRPSAEETEALMCGNLCRCTGYGGIKRAVHSLFPSKLSPQNS